MPRTEGEFRLHRASRIFTRKRDTRILETDGKAFPHEYRPFNFIVGYTLGVAEQIIFPEIDIDKITKIFGMEITFVTSAKSDEEAYALLREFGLPFKNAKKN